MTKIRIFSFLNILISFSTLCNIEGHLLESGRLLTKLGSRIDQKDEASGESASTTTFGQTTFDSTTSGDSKRRSHFKTRLVELDDDYDFNVPPPVDSGDPVKVSFSINLRNVVQVLEVEQILTVETTIRMMWIDNRARIKKPDQTGSNETLESGFSSKELPEYVTINPRLAKHFWIPDVFIDQAKQIREPTFHVLPASLRVYRNSMIRYAARVNFDVACPMDFHIYPGDIQLCHIKLESFGYTEDQLVFLWSNSSNINENISLAQFSVKVLTENGYKTDYYDKNYPGLILTIQLRRKLNYHLVQTFAPSTVYLAVSWLALYIPPDLVAERLAMSMTIMLTLTAMFASERQNVPRVSYVTCLDIWMFVCIFFVFLELCEFTVVLHLNQKQKTEKAVKIENMSKMFLPSLFLIFNLIYWPYLISHHMDYH